MTLSLVNSSAASGSIPVLKLATQFLAKVGSGLHLTSKASRKAKTSRATLDQGADSIYAGPQQQPPLSSKRLPMPQYPDLAHNGNITRRDEVASLTPRHLPMMALPALATSTYAPCTPSKVCEDGCIGSSDCQPDSPTEVLHWHHRPLRALSLPTAAARPVLMQRFEEALATERAACIAAEEAAAADTKRQEMEQLQRQLVDAQNMVASLRVVNKELQTEVDKLQSQIPSMEVAYENLKGSFFRLQSMYGSVKSKLSTATDEVARLRAELRAGRSQEQ